MKRGISPWFNPVHVFKRKSKHWRVLYTLIVTSHSFHFLVLRTETDFFAHWHRALSNNLNRQFGWCYFNHFTKNTPVPFLEALFARIFSYLSCRCTVQVSQRKTKPRRQIHTPIPILYFEKSIPHNAERYIQSYVLRVLMWVKSNCATYDPDSETVFMRCQNKVTSFMDLEPCTR